MPRFVVQKETFLVGMDKKPGHTPRLSDGKAAEAEKWNKMASEHPNDSKALTTLRLKREGMNNY